MSGSAISCTCCGKHGKKFDKNAKDCPCKQAKYCDLTCQDADWMAHKRVCSHAMRNVQKKIVSACRAGDWKAVLKFEGRLEELMACRLSILDLSGDTWMKSTDRGHDATLDIFCQSHQIAFNETGRHKHLRSSVKLHERRIPILGQLQRFRDQGDQMMIAARLLILIDKGAEAVRWMEEARNVGAAHGFYTMESQACNALGALAFDQGRREDGLGLMRNAIIAGKLNEFEDPADELHAMNQIMEPLFKESEIDEITGMMSRYQELSLQKEKRSIAQQMRAPPDSARVEIEVLSICKCI